MIKRIDPESHSVSAAFTRTCYVRANDADNHAASLVSSCDAT